MIEKISEPSKWCPGCTCNDPEHNPPTLISLDPGRYKHTCPSCETPTEFCIPIRTKF